MKNHITSAALIEELAADIAPVRVLNRKQGAITGLVAAFGSVALVAVFFGLWSAAFRGEASAAFYLVNGMLTIFAVASGSAVIRMASPAVGNRYEGAFWALAMLAALPVATLAALFGQHEMHAIAEDPYGVHCTSKAMLAATISAAAFVLWLRRGAPVQPSRAGLLVGLASGAIGAATYGFSCRIDTLPHVAVWHLIPVVACGLIGRLTLPRLLRW